MVRALSVGILFLALLGLCMAVIGASQPAMTAKHAPLVLVGASAYAGYVTYVLATRWASFRNFINDPWTFR